MRKCHNCSSPWRKSHNLPISPLMNTSFLWPREQTWECVGPSRPPSPPASPVRVHISAPSLPPTHTCDCLPLPHDNSPKPHACNDAVVRGLQLADPLRVSGRCLSGRDGVPLPGLYRGAPGAVPKAHRDMRRDSARTGLRVLPRVRPARGRAVRRVHPEVLHRFAMLPDARLGASPGATGAGPGAMSAQSGHRGKRPQTGAAGANQRSVSLPETCFSSINF